MMADQAKIGELITEPVGRDAIHIAVAPVVAVDYLEPGQHVGLVTPGNLENVAALSDTKLIGIVDPFLTARVEPGQRFYLFLYPNSITNLRHVWSHPAFAAKGKA
jgi:hypothetical protein